MIVKSGALKFAGNHMEADKFILSIEHETIGRINGEFTAEEITSIVEGLTDMLLQQVEKFFTNAERVVSNGDGDNEN